MKEFKNTVKQTFQVGWQEVMGYSIISLFAGIIGIIIMLIIMAVAGEEEEYLAFGALMVAMISIVLILFAGVFSLHMDFNLAISLGKTRKYYVPAKYLLTVVNCLACTIISLLIGLFEEFLYAKLYPNARCLFSIDFLLKYPAVMVGVVLLIPMVVLLLGALFIKFGMKFFWICWVLWMLSFTVLPRMITAVAHKQDSFLAKTGSAIVQFFSGFNQTQAIIALIVAVVVGMAGAYLLLRKQRVTL